MSGDEFVPPANFDWRWPSGINDMGQVVGMSRNGRENDRATLWTVGTDGTVITLDLSKGSASAMTSPRIRQRCWRLRIRDYRTLGWACQNFWLHLHLGCGPSAPHSLDRGCHLWPPEWFPVPPTPRLTEHRQRKNGNRTLPNRTGSSDFANPRTDHLYQSPDHSIVYKSTLVVRNEHRI